MTRFDPRDRVRALPGGDKLVHLLVFLLGLAFIVLGLVLVVLPGPLTIPPILVGLLIWSTEFDFAERLLDKAKAQASEAWHDAKAKPVRTAVVAGGGTLLLVVAVLVAAQQGWIDAARDAVG